MADNKKFSISRVDEIVEGKSPVLKTLWQIAKFVFVSCFVALLQFGLALLLPLIFDKMSLPELPSFLAAIFNENSVPADKFEIYAPNGIVTWGYVLPFFLSNLLANIYGYIQNKKTTFKSDAPTYCFVIYVVLMISLILFSTWLQAVVVAGLEGLSAVGKTGFVAWLIGAVSNDSTARLIAAMAAGALQMLILFPMEKFVLLKEKKEEK